jgi:hypothetical protein
MTAVFKMAAMIVKTSAISAQQLLVARVAMSPKGREPLLAVDGSCRWTATRS